MIIISSTLVVAEVWQAGIDFGCVGSSFCRGEGKTTKTEGLHDLTKASLDEE